MKNRRPFPRTQRGLATILVVLLVGLALTATALGVAHQLRGAQDKTLTMHASTLSQLRSWAGAELLRQYLSTVDALAPPWPALPWAVPIAGIDASTLSATIRSMTGPDAEGRYLVSADIVGAGAGATTTLRAVYAIDTVVSGGGGETLAIDVANFYYDLEMSGSITIQGDNLANFNVMGDVTLQNAAINGVNAINSTGDVTLGGGVKVNQIYANGDVWLSGSSSAQSISALGNVHDNSSGTQSVINANGTVDISNGVATTVNAIGSVTAGSGGTHNLINTDGSLTVTNGVVNTANVRGDVTVNNGTIKNTNTMGSMYWNASGTGALTVNANGLINYNAAGGILSARGDVSLTGGGATTVRTLGNTYVRNYGGIGLLQGQGNLQVDKHAAVAGTIGGTLNVLQKSNKSVLVTILGGFIPTGVATINLTAITPLEPFVLTRPVVDAYALKSASNYIIEYRPEGYVRVGVQNVAGITSGYYALASDATKKDYLCPVALFVPLTKTCAVPGTLSKTICQGYSSNNTCFTHGTADGIDTWKIAGTSLTTGAYWFEGDLEVGTGVYFNTFIASGDISTSGQNVTKSPNSAGYGPVCANSPTDGVPQNPNFAGLYPTNFCNVADGELTLDSLGNIAMLAGGYKNGVFSGGNITLGANTKTYGTVIAGNLFNSNGNTTIYGYVAAAGQAVTGDSNSLGGSTTLDLTALPSTYTPDELPCVGECTPESAIGQARVLWTRYL